MRITQSTENPSKAEEMDILKQKRYSKIRKSQIKSLPMDTKKFYLTTAIAYTNAGPHLGHALEFIEADAMARYKRLMGYDVYFLTGTDEHGIKNYNTAKKAGRDPLEFVQTN